MRLELTRFKSFLDSIQQIGLCDLSRRKVDTQAQRAMARRIELPLTHLRTSFIQHPLTNRHDQTGLFGNRNEVARINEAATRMIPAHECFEARETSRRQSNNRLVVNRKFFVFY